MPRLSRPDPSCIVANRLECPCSGHQRLIDSDTRCDAAAAAAAASEKSYQQHLQLRCLPKFQSSLKSHCKRVRLFNQSPTDSKTVCSYSTASTSRLRCRPRAVPGASRSHYLVTQWYRSRLNVRQAPKYLGSVGFPGYPAILASSSET